MVTSNEDQKEYWTTNKIIEELRRNLITTVDKDEVYANMKKWPDFSYIESLSGEDPKTRDNQPPAFIIELNDISEKVKEENC